LKPPVGTHEKEAVDSALSEVIKRLDEAATWGDVQALSACIMRLPAEVIDNCQRVPMNDVKLNRFFEKRE